jgi:multidrug transporter EmrE-like cation transporter
MDTFGAAGALFGGFGAVRTLFIGSLLYNNSANQPKKMKLLKLVFIN